MKMYGIWQTLDYIARHAITNAGVDFEIDLEDAPFEWAER